MALAVALEDFDPNIRISEHRHRRFFIRRSSTPITTPVNLWVDIRVWPIAGNCHAGFTRGLRALGCKEFEVRAAPESAKALRERLRALCAYVLTHGAVIRDGNTVGQDADERITVLLCRSVHGLQDTVLRLDYAEDFQPKRPCWKLI